MLTFQESYLKFFNHLKQPLAWAKSLTQIRLNFMIMMVTMVVMMVTMMIMMVMIKVDESLISVVDCKRASCCCCRQTRWCVPVPVALYHCTCGLPVYQNLTCKQIMTNVATLKMAVEIMMVGTPLVCSSTSKHRITMITIQITNSIL